MLKRCAMVWGMAAFLIVVAPGDGAAFRCGSGLVNPGDRTGKVLIECGPPTSRETVGSRTTVRTVKTERSTKKEKAAVQSSRRDASQKVERWFYNCGEHDFVYVLTFEGGVLAKEETEGYGKGKSDCLGKGNRR
jgi:hypothetical protein